MKADGFPLRMINDRIAVKRVEPKSKSGLIYQPSIRDGSLRGEVVSVPGGCDLSIGDFVIYERDRGDLFQIKGEQVLLLKEEDILAVLEPV